MRNRFLERPNCLLLIALLAGATLPARAADILVHYGGEAGPPLVLPPPRPIRSLADLDDDESPAKPRGRDVAAPSPAGQPEHHEGRDKKAKATPPLSWGPIDVDLVVGNNDPQLAVGKQYLAISAYDEIVFYKKGDSAPSAPGNGLWKNPLTTDELFGWLLDPTNKANANQFLKLTKTDCDPWVSDRKVRAHCTSKTYDVRLRYDKATGRFFVLAHTQNCPGGSCTIPKTATSPEHPDRKRRSMNFVAVSKSEDPHDGFQLFFYDEVLDQGICSDPNQCPKGTRYSPGQACDYPTFTVNDGFLVEADNCGQAYGTLYQLIHLIALAPLIKAQPQTQPFPEAETIADPPGAFAEAITFNLRPVENVGPPSSTTFLVRSRGGPAPNGIEVFSINHSKPPPFKHGAFLIQTGLIASPINPPMPQSTAALKITNMGTQVLSSAVQNGVLVAAFGDCRKWPGEASCTPAVHLVELNAISKTLLHDRVFGKGGPDDPHNEPPVAYALPSAMFTGRGDIVVTYLRSSAGTVFPETRFSLWHHSEPDIRSSALLHAGTGSCGKEPTCFNWDTAGIARDPEDPQAVWIANGYFGGAAGKALPTIALGKVLVK